MQIIRRSILLAAVLLSLGFGWFLGQKTFTYVTFFVSEPMIYPCPYTDDPSVNACSYRRDEPPPDLAVRWHGWPRQNGEPTFPPTSGNWLRDFLTFDPEQVLGPGE